MAKNEKCLIQKEELIHYYKIIRTTYAEEVQKREPLFKKISIWLWKIKCPRTTVIDSPLYIHTNKHIYPYNTFICIYMGNYENIQAIWSLHAYWMRIHWVHTTLVSRYVLSFYQTCLSWPEVSNSMFLLQFPETFCNVESFFLRITGSSVEKKIKGAFMHDFHRLAFPSHR